MERQTTHKIIVSIAIMLGLGIASSSCGDRSPSDSSESAVNRIKVFVSIVPQKTFIEAIAKDAVDVHVMIRPGFSPATYDPTPRQLLELAKAELYFRIGVPFEDVWMHRIREAGRAMRIIDMRSGITLRSIQAHDHDEAENEHGHGHEHEGGMDPHIWLDPIHVKRQAATMTEALKAIDPQRAAAYDANLHAFQEQLDTLDRDIASRIRESNAEKFIIFHPALGYFAQRYGLEQIPIELEGKSPGASALRKVIDRARAENIHSVFVQKEFSSHAAEKIAEAIDGTVTVLDPLAPHYFDNMRRIADAIASQNGQ